MPIPILRNVDIVGNQYRLPSEKVAFTKLVPGDMVALKSNAGNLHDPYAVEVWDSIYHLGFLPMQMSAAIHLLWNRPEINLWIEATVTEVIKDAPWRVRITVTAE